MSLSFMSVLWAWDNFSSNNNVLAFFFSNMVCLCTAYRSYTGRMYIYRIETLQKWRAYTGKYYNCTIGFWICGKQWSLLCFPRPKTATWILGAWQTIFWLVFSDQVALNGDTSLPACFKISQPVSYDSLSK